MWEGDGSKCERQPKLSEDLRNEGGWIGERLQQGKENWRKVDKGKGRDMRIYGRRN